MNVSSHLIERRTIAQYIVSKYRGQGTELSPPETELERYALYQQVRYMIRFIYTHVTNIRYDIWV